jgi:hypothetical protein
MPVILLIGTADRFNPEIEDYFKDKYQCCTLRDTYPNIRSAMANLEPNVQYVFLLGKKEFAKICFASR